MNEQVKQLGINDLLNTDLNDLADLAGFDVPNNGYYKLSVDASTKEINNKPAVVLDYEVVEVLEMADPTATPPITGTKFGETFFLDNEFGVGNMKKALKPFADAFGVGNISALLEQIKGVSVFATVKQQADKKDTSKIYARVSGTTLC